MGIETRALRETDWPAVTELFGDNGACGGCWCMYWRAPRGGKAWAAAKGAPNRRSFRRLVESGRAQGCLAFDGDTPVGWCSLGPKRDFPYFTRSRTFEATEDPEVWSVTCFFIDRRWRGRGVASALLAEAIELARRGGARVLEGYPIQPRGTGKAPAAFAWTGVPALFETQGFAPMPAKGERPVYVLELRRRHGRERTREASASSLRPRKERAPEPADTLGRRGRWFRQRAGDED